MEKLILARHAESVFNVRGVLNGNPRNAGGLSARGVAQAELLSDLLAEVDIDLCVTTDFDRTRETADIVLRDRDVPRLIVPELNDPPCGRFELRPYAEYLEWRIENGPDVALPGETMTERECVAEIARAFEALIARPERTVLAILHGFCIGWMLGSVARDTRQEAGFAKPHRLSKQEIERALDEVRDDLYRYLSVP